MDRRGEAEVAKCLALPTRRRQQPVGRPDDPERADHAGGPVEHRRRQPGVAQCRLLVLDRVPPLPHRLQRLAQRVRIGHGTPGQPLDLVRRPPRALAAAALMRRALPERVASWTLDRTAHEEVPLPTSCAPTGRTCR